ncbi:hypothetical protein [Oscillatoria sp. FACHB-1406]|uniref:hypothetical protein n=1 Tax=Oscillatoria sp. FACHB-1406 TaxID=2692846 RepID=UPI0016844352|nr:hypothetical protein [Oscillatoria sp. FACHB-1406]MBD2579509.1 hypothetical protein [Oscillatoria sp. FACHB-1406]
MLVRVTTATLRPMLIQRRIPLALAFSSLVAGLTSPVLAQYYPTYPNSSRSNGVTLSGESLVNIENRTAEDDSTSFFNGTAPVSADENNLQQNSAPPSLFRIDERYEIIFNSPIQQPEYVNQFRQTADTDASQSVRVRFPVGDGTPPSN